MQKMISKNPCPFCFCERHEWNVELRFGEEITWRAMCPAIDIEQHVLSEIYPPAHTCFFDECLGCGATTGWR
jgi:hypothetical protein